MLFLRGTLRSRIPSLRLLASIQSATTNHPFARTQTLKCDSTNPHILKFVMPGPHLVEYWNDAQDGGDVYSYPCKTEEQFTAIANILPDRKIEFSKDSMNAFLAQEIPLICRKINEGKGRELVEQGLLSQADFSKLSKTRLLHQSRQCIGEPSDSFDIDVRTTDDGKALVDCRLDYSFGYLAADMADFPDNTSLYAFMRNCISHIVAAKLDSTIDETNLKLKKKISSSKNVEANGEQPGNLFFDSIAFRVTCSRQIKPFLGDYFISRLAVLSRDTGEYVS